MSSDTKLARSITVLLTANKYRNDLPKFVEFITKNDSYFRALNKSDIEKLREGNPLKFVEDKEHNEQVPKFVPIDYERNKNKK
jgi:hypothetical protein